MNTKPTISGISAETRTSMVARARIKSSLRKCTVDIALNGLQLVTTLYYKKFMKATAYTIKIIKYASRCGLLIKSR